MDQLSFTRLVDFDILESAQVPCFGTLERAIRFLAAHWGEAGAVFPVPKQADGAPMDMGQRTDGS